MKDPTDEVREAMKNKKQLKEQWQRAQMGEPNLAAPRSRPASGLMRFLGWVLLVALIVAIIAYGWALRTGNQAILGIFRP